MIIDQTPYSLVMKALCNEAEKVSYAWTKGARAATKELFKRKTPGSHSFVAYWTYYTVQESRNTYLLWYSLDEKDIMMGFYLLVVNTKNGDRTFYAKGDSQTLYVFTGHFFSRYRERKHYGSSMTTEELVIRFLDKNIPGMEMLDLSKLNRNASSYKNGIAVDFAEGVAFASMPPRSAENANFTYLKFNTFLSFEELHENQMEASPRGSYKVQVHQSQKSLFLATNGFAPLSGSFK